MKTADLVAEDAQQLAPGLELFTIRLDANGIPVERLLSEMSGAEVVSALEFHDNEVFRLIAFAEPAKADLLQRSAAGEKIDVVRAKATAALMDDQLQAMKKAQRLARIVIGQLPPERAVDENMSIAEAVRRFWPR